MIKYEEVEESFKTLKNKRIYTDWGDTLYDFNHKAFDNIEQYITEQQKKDELLELYREKDNHIENWENYDRSCDMGYIAKLEYLQEKIKELEETLK